MAQSPARCNPPRTKKSPAQGGGKVKGGRMRGALGAGERRRWQRGPRGALRRKPRGPGRITHRIAPRHVGKALRSRHKVLSAPGGRNGSRHVGGLRRGIAPRPLCGRPRGASIGRARAGCGTGCGCAVPPACAPPARTAAPSGAPPMYEVRRGAAGDSLPNEYVTPHHCPSDSNARSALGAQQDCALHNAPLPMQTPCHPATPRARTPLL